MKKLYIASLLFVFAAGFSQNPAAIDMTFDHTDYRSRFTMTTRMSIVQPNGQLLVMGDWAGLSHYNENGWGYETPHRNLVRLNADLTVDEALM